MCVCIHQTLALSLYPNGFLGADGLREGFTAQGRQFWTGRPIIKGGKKWREKMCGSIRVLASGGEDSNHFRAKSALKLVFPPHHSYSTNIKRDLLVCFRNRVSNFRIIHYVLNNLSWKKFKAVHKLLTHNDAWIIAFLRK